MNLPSLANQYLPFIVEEMRSIVDLARVSASTISTPIPSMRLWDELHEMLAYHLGWTTSNLDGGGKHIRPVLLLLVTSSAEGNWKSALPAAAAVELLHNFSLIHDDIEDQSPLRRGRPTLWKRWGVPLAVNTGDVLFTLSHLALQNLTKTVPSHTVLEACHIFHNTCLALTQGQHLDITFEHERSLSQDAYWPVIQGKTASLLSACAELGAVCAGTHDNIRHAYRNFGMNLGLAFQVQDDLLGIWGNDFLIGKSTASDLLSGKKTLPVLYGLEQNGLFATRWLEGPLSEDEIVGVADQLKKEGAFDYTYQIAHKFTQKALQDLDDAMPLGEAGDALGELTTNLLERML